MAKDLYIAPAITSQRIVHTGMLLEGSISAGGEDPGTPEGPGLFGVKEEAQGLSDNPFSTEGMWDE